MKIFFILFLFYISSCSLNYKQNNFYIEKIELDQFLSSKPNYEQVIQRLGFANEIIWVYNKKGFKEMRMFYSNFPIKISSQSQLENGIFSLILNHGSVIEFHYGNILLEHHHGK